MPLKQRFGEEVTRVYIPQQLEELLPKLSSYVDDLLQANTQSGRPVGQVFSYHLVSTPT